MSVSYDPYKLIISVHRFSHPDIVQTFVEIVGKDGTHSYHGDLSQWMDVPRHYNVLMRSPDVHGYHALLALEPETRGVRTSSFEWLDNEDDYDAERMAVGPVIPLPNSQDVLVFIQRSTTYYVFNPLDETIVRRGSLGFVPGRIVVSNDGRKAWMVNGNAILTFDLEQVCIVSRQNLQGDGMEGISTSVTDLAVDPGETVCCIAWSDPGAIVAVGIERRTNSSRVALDYSPTEVAIFRDGRFYCRERLTGHLRGGVLTLPKRYI